jgi:hypothetical protein
LILDAASWMPDELMEDPDSLKKLEDLVTVMIFYGNPASNI